MANTSKMTISRTAMFTVLALYYTSAPAQTADPLAPTVATTPVPATTASAAETPAPATAMPSVTLAPPAPGAAPQASTPVASGPVIGKPVVHSPDTAVTAEPTPAPRRAARVVTAPAPTAARAVRPTAEAPVAMTAAAPIPATPVIAPVETPARPRDATPPAPVPTATVTRTSTTDDGSGDDSFELIGLGAAGLLVLGGGAFALSRRKRHEEPEDALLTTEPVILADPIAPAAFAPAAVDASVATNAQPAPLADGFDLSRYGRHTRAAYGGPTPENPSLSLRKRLKRASFFDGRERVAGITSTVAPTTTTHVAEADNEQLVFRPGGRASTKFGFRPAY